MKSGRRTLLRNVLLCAALPLLAACAAAPPPQHPLIGKLWDERAQRFIEPAQLMERAAAARIVLLGEIHDNAEHHRLQLRVLQELLKRGKRPLLVMEQYDLDQQAQLDAARRNRPDALAALMRKGWDWPLYQPLVELAARENLPIVAANAPRDMLRRISREGFDALGEFAAVGLALEATWTAARQKQLAEDVREGHCGKVPEHVVEAIVKAQRARDALMADAMLRGPDDVVALIGNGHARRDLGVPLYLAARAPSAAVLSIGLIQVDAPAEPAAYAQGPLGLRFDYVWFTERTQRAADPCDSIPAMKPQQG